jgi:hypothetical protein
MIRHLLQIFFTLGLTFIVVFPIISRWDHGSFRRRGALLGVGYL